MDAKKVIEVQTKEQFDELLKSAAGKPVAVDFVQADCGYCDEDKPEVEKLANACGDTLVLQVDISKPGLEKLGESFNVEGTPTLLYADKAEQMTPEGAKEYDSAKQLRRLKCAVPAKK